MNKLSQRQMTALGKAVHKWNGIVSGDGEDRGLMNCPLCSLYIQNNCKSCPVSMWTGLSKCESTPWENWCEHHTNSHVRKEHFSAKILCNHCSRLAKEELAFLKKLLRIYKKRGFK